MGSTEAIATLAKKIGDYDPRLNSEDVIERQQAEIEALRTCLIAANSESSGEYDRLRRQLDAMTASHEGQLRNTLAFKAEADRLREAAAALLADVRRRYPGEELRCPFMRDLEAAVTTAQK